MKLQYKVRQTHIDDVPMQVSTAGLSVFDEKGREYKIQVNQEGRLTISGVFGDLNVHPWLSNVIIVESDEQTERFEKRRYQRR